MKCRDSNGIMWMSAEGRHPERMDGMIYITGDTHGQFGRIEAFCERFGTSREDILIILGDAGINFGGWNRDCVKKRFLESLPITLFCIHGNHDHRQLSGKTVAWRYGVL